MLTISDKLTCPLCGGRFQFHEAVAVPEALELAATANRFGALWPSVIAYAESFQQPGGRGLSVARFTAIVNELAAMFTGQGFVYGRRKHRIDRDVLIAALKETAQVGKSGFKNHNYLKVVAIDMQTKIDRQRGAEKEKQLRAKEQQLMAGERPNGADPQTAGRGHSSRPGAQRSSRSEVCPPRRGAQPNPQTTRCDVTSPDQQPDRAKNMQQVGAIIDQLNFKPKKEDAGADSDDHQS